MSVLKLLVLPGDGIGPEVTESALKVLDVVADKGGLSVEIERAAFGGASIDEHGIPMTDDVLRLAKESTAVLLGAVGGPKWDDQPTHLRPEKGLLQLRKGLGVYANLRPSTFFDALLDSSPLKADVCRGADMLIVRELVGGIYFGEPRGVSGEGDTREGINTMRYSAPEIRRVAKVAFEAAQKRDKRLLSVDKENVLEVQRLWRTVVDELAADYPDVSVEHMYVDNCAMQLVRRPTDFDVIVTGNMLGDIISDAAAALTGSLGMLPSASIGDGPGLFEPVHGSAPDIAGKGISNPLATILSLAMLLRHSGQREDLADIIEKAVHRVLEKGLRTADLAGGSGESVSNAEMTQAVIEELKFD